MNEVGSDPAHNGLSVEDFHAYNETMQATHPATMTTLSTHDTKRSDDVRARLAVLSEIPIDSPMRSSVGRRTPSQVSERDPRSRTPNTSTTRL